MERGPVRKSPSDEVIVHRQMGRQLGSRHHRVVRHDFIARAVVQNPDYRAVLHRIPREIPHPLSGTLAEEPASFQVRKDNPGPHGRADGREGTHAVVDVFRNIYRNIASISFRPAFLPEIAGHLRYHGYLPLQGGTSFKYRFVIHNIHHLSKLGKTSENTRMARPATSTDAVLAETPFHSLRTSPHTLLNTTLSDISMHQEKA